MTKKTQPPTASSLRRKRMDEVALNGRLRTDVERDAIMQQLDKRPGLDEVLTDMDAAAAEYLKKALNQNELRRRVQPARNPVSR